MRLNRNPQACSLLLLAVGACVLAAGLSGCRCPKPTTKTGQLVQAAEVTKAAAVEVATASDAIGKANLEVATKAPELLPQTVVISENVAKLQATSGKLETTAGEIKTAAADATATAGELAAAQKRIAELESAQSGLLAKILTLGAVAGLGLAVVSGIWLRSWSGAMTGLAIFGACVGGQWLLAYRAIIGITMLVLAGLYAAWAIFRERLATMHVVKLVESFKPALDPEQFVKVANAIQSKSTKAIVNAAQRAIGVKKP